jgi:glycine/D-amino acid oxidase-like deaminating enzyme
MITSTKEFDLAVVGAGIVGLACAPGASVGNFGVGLRVRVRVASIVD